MRIEPEVGGCSIVLRGTFNPAIFSPLWFAQNEIIEKSEAEAAQVSVVHPDIAIFQLGKIALQVERDRFSASTNEAPWITICDFVAKTFGEFLVHTPVNQFGINRTVHFNFGSTENRKQLGRALAPLAPWGSWGKEIESNPDEYQGGLVDLKILQPRLEGGKSSGHLQAHVAPSARIKGNTGVFMEINDHFTFAPLAETVGCEDVVKKLIAQFEPSMKKAEQIIDQIMSLRDEPGK